MKKAIATLTAAGTYLYVALPAFAQGSSFCATGDFKGLCALKADKFGSIVGNVVTILLIIAVVISLFYLVFGGIKWVTSGGDKAKVESARNHIIAAIIGLVISFLAFFILSVVLSFFGMNLSTIKLPKITGN